MMDKLRYVGISSSPRHANTEIMVNKTLDTAKQETEAMGYQAEIIFLSLAGKKIEPCVNCDGCVRKLSYCILKDDWLDIVKHVVDPVPNGLVLGSPVYFYNVNAKMRAFMERWTSLVKAIWHPEFPYPAPDWGKTAAGAVTIGYDRNGGQEMALNAMLQFLLLNKFVTVAPGHEGGYVGAAGWQMGIDGAVKDAVLQDEEGLKQCAALGKRIAQTAILLSGRKFKSQEG